MYVLYILYIIQIYYICTYMYVYVCVYIYIYIRFIAPSGYRYEIQPALAREQGQSLSFVRVCSNGRGDFE